MSFNIGTLEGTIELVDKFSNPLEAAGDKVVSTMGKAVTSMIDMSDRMTNLSERTGVGVEALQRWDAIGSTVGVGAEEIAQSFGKFSRALESGSERTAAAVSKLGLSTAQLKAMSPEKQIETMLTTLGKMPATTERTALAMELLGRSAARLVPIGADFKNLSDRAEELGFIMSATSIKAADDLGDALGFLERTLGGVTNNLGATVTSSGALLEAVEAASDVVALLSKFLHDNQAEITAWVDKGVNLAADGAVALMHAIVDLYDWLGGLEGIIASGEDAWNAAVGVWDAAISVLGTIGEVINAVTFGLVDFETAAENSNMIFDALKVTWESLKFTLAAVGIALLETKKLMMFDGDPLKDEVQKDIDALKAMQLAASDTANEIVSGDGAQRKATEGVKEAHDWIDKLRAKVTEHGTATEDAAEKTASGSKKITESLKSMEAFAKLSVEAQKSLTDATIALLPPMEQQHAKIKQQMEASVAAAEKAGVHGASLVKLRQYYADVAAMMEKKIQQDLKEKLALENLAIVEATHQRYLQADREAYAQLNQLAQVAEINDVKAAAALEGHTYAEGQRLAALAATKYQIDLKTVAETEHAVALYQTKALTEGVTDADWELVEATIALAIANGDNAKRTADAAEAQRKAAEEYRKAVDAAEAFSGVLSTANKIFEMMGGSSDSGVGRMLAHMSQASEGGAKLAKGVLDFNKEGATAADKMKAVEAAVLGAVEAMVALNEATRGNVSLTQGVIGGASAGASAGAAFGPKGAAAGAAFGAAFAFGANEHVSVFAKGAVAALLPIAAAPIAIGAAFHAIFGQSEADAAKAAASMRADFVDQMGGLEALQMRAAAAGVSLADLFNAKTAEEFTEALNGVAGELNVIVGHQKEIGAQIEAQQALIDSQNEAWAAVEDAVKRYGFEISELGPVMAQQKLDEMAGGLLKDYELLSAAGVDHTAIVKRMGPAMSEYVQSVVQAGGKIPAAMRPALQAFVDMGELTDDNGEKLEDLGGLSFAEDLTEQVGRIIDKIQLLIDALNHVPPNKTVTIEYKYKQTGEPPPTPVPPTPPTPPTPPDPPDPPDPTYVPDDPYATSSFEVAGGSMSAYVYRPPTPAPAAPAPAGGGAAGAAAAGAIMARQVLENRINLDGREMTQWISDADRAGRLVTRPKETV